MLTFRLDYIRGGIAMYSYFPEGDESRIGHVGLNLETGQRILDALADGDEFRSYAFHMACRIEEMNKANDFRENGLVAWC